MTPEQERQAREAFEAMISAPPFERPIACFPDDGKYYISITVELAWQAYLAAHAQQQEIIGAKDAEIARLRACVAVADKCQRFNADAGRNCTYCCARLDEYKIARAALEEAP